MKFFENIEGFENVSPALQWAIFIVGCLIALVAAVALVVSLWLFVKYIKFNRRQNSSNITGGDAARKILDANWLKHIKVSTFGSILFGNSYSHYFKKVRIRRLTKNKKSITSLAIGAEKASLAVLDKEGDKDMRQRVKLTPFIYFGPFAFIPLLAIGIAIDILMFNFTGGVTIGFAVVGLIIYAISFVLSIKVLKTEIKAQKRAIKIMLDSGMASKEETEMMEELYKLYNIQYVIDIVIAFLQMVLKALELVAKIQNGNSSKSSSN